METITVAGRSISEEVRERAARIKVVLMDVDGVLTDGKLYYYAGPEEKMMETKAFNSQDGLGLYFLADAGLSCGVISGRESHATVERARMLKMKYVYQGLLDKVGAFEEILADARVADAEVAFIGDDFTDVPLMRRAGLAVAVANARPEVSLAGHYVTTVPGGEGAVREVIEIILKAQQRWQDVLAKYGLG